MINGFMYAFTGEFIIYECTLDMKIQQKCNEDPLHIIILRSFIIVHLKCIIFIIGSHRKSHSMRFICFIRWKKKVLDDRQSI